MLREFIRLAHRLVSGSVSGPSAGPASVLELVVRHYTFVASGTNPDPILKVF